MVRLPFFLFFLFLFSYIYILDRAFIFDHTTKFGLVYIESISRQQIKCSSNNDVCLLIQTITLSEKEKLRDKNIFFFSRHNIFKKLSAPESLKLGLK